ncbi:hypothetical protein CK623_07730 [Vandammella animalimorsus]|uniref:Uncharacterized protein n=1 Tax=Vandammella animalimorsus TaxID=2029117 RepID=A0A2A2AN75_9BURK|nr:hypothetical protein CK623_07730 [Vandammella animalimorsus]
MPLALLFALRIGGLAHGRWRLGRLPPGCSCARGIGLGIVLGRAAAQTRMPAATPGRSAMAWQEGA